MAGGAQDHFPHALLPAALQEDNPLSLNRRVDGVLRLAGGPWR